MSEFSNDLESEQAIAGKSKSRPIEVTPGNVHSLGLPFVVQNQSGSNFWDIKTGDYFIEMEGQYYGWDDSTVQVTSMGPGNGPPLHTHPVEEIFVITEGECSFIIGTEMIHVKAPGVVRVPPHTPHSSAERASAQPASHSTTPTAPHRPVTISMALRSLALHRRQVHIRTKRPLPPALNEWPRNTNRPNGCALLPLDLTAHIVMTAGRNKLMQRWKGKWAILRC